MKKNNISGYVYLDNNSTTVLCDPVISTMNTWSTCYNPSSGSILSKEGKQVIDKVRTYVNKLNNLKNNYSIIFTSGASESNCLILRSVCDAYLREKSIIPHIISSSIEHHSVLDCLDTLSRNNYATISLVKPGKFGQIEPDEVKKHIQPNTALISIMYANNETGVINNIPEIGKLAHSFRIPLHSDCVQIYGRYKIDIPGSKLDAVSMSFHKLYGPKGAGMLIISNELISGYKLEGQISGSQQHGLRGGTENPITIAGAGAAMLWNFTNREKKNMVHHKLKEFLLASLKKKYHFSDMSKFIEETKLDGEQNSVISQSSDIEDSAHVKLLNDTTPIEKCDNVQAQSDSYYPIELVVVGSTNKEIPMLCNTLLLGAVANGKRQFCNVKCKKELEKKKIIVSITSACQTGSEKASHVLYEINAKKSLKRGVLRITMSDYTTKKDISVFLTEFCKILDKYK